jgi:hypothetical protein
MACDGSANHAKLKADGGGWVATDMKYRGYGPASKEALRPWIVDVYSTDRMGKLPPLSEDVVRLGVVDATAKAKKAIASGRDAVYLPLGYQHRRVRSFEAIKTSAFIFRTPKQAAAIRRQVARFRERNGCGLELLALRRDYGGRPRGSIAAILVDIYEHIRDGGRDITRLLHLDRHRGTRGAALVRRSEVRERRAESDVELFSSMEIAEADLPDATMGVIETAESGRNAEG